MYKHFIKKFGRYILSAVAACFGLAAAVFFKAYRAAGILFIFSATVFSRALKRSRPSREEPFTVDEMIFFDEIDE